MTLNNVQFALLLNNRQLLNRIEMLKNAINSIEGTKLIVLQRQLDSVAEMLEESRQDIANISSITVKNIVQRLNDIDETINYITQEIKNNYKTLDDKIDANDTNINNKVDNLDTTINKKIDDTTDSLTEKIENTESSLIEKIDGVDVVINEKMDGEILALHELISTTSDEINDTIKNNDITINNKINTEVTNLNKVIQNDYNILDKKIDDTSIELNEKIEILNTSLDGKIDTANSELKESIKTIEQNNNVAHETINNNILKLTEDLSELSKSSTLLIEAVEILLKTHTDNTIIHVTQDDKDLWNSSLENAKDYAKQLFDGVTSFNIEIVDELPIEDINNMTIYFMRNIHDNEGDYYEEYMYINNKWEIIGSTFVNLSPYLLKNDFDTIITNYLKNTDFQTIISKYLTNDDFKEIILDYALSSDLNKYALQSDMHTHNNKIVLDGLSQNTNGELLYNDNLMGSKISKSENNAIQSNIDGLFVEDKTQDINNLKIKTDSILISQKTINVDLDYGFVKIDSINDIILNTGIPFNIVDYEKGIKFDSTDYSFTLQPNKTYSVESQCWINETSNKWFLFHIYNVTTQTYCGIPGRVVTSSNPFFVIAKASIQTGNTEEKVLIKVYAGTTPITDKIEAYFEVKEIGRSVVTDPLEYVNFDKGIEDTPVGHILAHMGITAPTHYLICDGTEYNIIDYPYLAQHIYNNFGSYNHFGGDGLITFAVPDLRAEFLRGSGIATRATGIGGTVGEHQNPTYIPRISTYFSSAADGWISSWIKTNSINAMYNQDIEDTVQGQQIVFSQVNGGHYAVNNYQKTHITIKPTNTSVLYCIKYEPTYYMVVQQTPTQEEINLIQEEVTEIKEQNTLIVEQNTLLQNQLDEISTLLDSINKVVI